jgi:hypothetical protein
MGVAAYQRGNVGIHIELYRHLGCGCPVCHPHVPTPRPPGWGSAAAARAEDAARRILSGAARYGRPRPDVETLTACVIESARVGEKTARSAAEKLLSEV